MTQLDSELNDILIVDDIPENLNVLMQILAEHSYAIVSSGYSDDPVVTDPKKYGFCGSLNKPYTNKELADILTAVVK